jgi:malonyl-CoA O-methyltransferase
MYNQRTKNIMNEFEIDKREIRRAFSNAPAQYDAAAVLQREVCQRMLERLEYIKLKPERILDVGSGTGWGTRRLKQRYPSAQLIALDIASGMLLAARGHSGWWQKLFGGARQLQVCGDMEALPLSRYGMVQPGGAVVQRSAGHVCRTASRA